MLSGEQGGSEMISFGLKSQAALYGEAECKTTHTLRIMRLTATMHPSGLLRLLVGTRRLCAKYIATGGYYVIKRN